MRILYITTISATVNAFFKSHIKMLVSYGHQVDMACNFKDMEPDPFYLQLGCKPYQVDFSRAPISTDNVTAFKQLKKVIESGNYDIVHCHTPNASVITRLVCRKFRKKNGLKVFYTAHGFHFYKGAPKLNWLVYYPVEKFCSRFTDKLITINKEDYELAKNKFKAKEVCYVPGVGIDLSKYENVQVDRKELRQQLGIPDEAFLIVSIGELSKRKNQITILQALAKLEDKNIHYILVGNGLMLQQLQQYTEENGISDRVHFLGYRTDIAQLYKISDVCCFPSIHEGLPVALMEAMACGTPIVCSKIRGNADLIDKESGILLDPHNADEFAAALQKMSKDVQLRDKFSKANLNKIHQFAEENILKELKGVYNVGS